MSKANRKTVYDECKNNKKNHLCPDELRREFEGDKRTTEKITEEEAKAKDIAEAKLTTGDGAPATPAELKEVATPGVED